MSAQAPGPLGPGSGDQRSPNGAAPRRTLLPWLLAGSSLAGITVLLLAVLLGGSLFRAVGVEHARGATERPQGAAVSSAAASEAAVESPAPAKLQSPQGLTSHISAWFEFPAHWVQTNRGIMIIRDDQPVPTEKFNAQNEDFAATAMLEYEAISPPEGAPPVRQMRADMEITLQKLRGASAETLLRMHDDRGFGCTSFAKFSQAPDTWERDKLHGLSYGFACMSYRGPVQGQTVLAYDETGVIHRLSVEALQEEWDRNHHQLTAILDSLRP